jgi:hypothetical protein
MSNHLYTELMLRALDMALLQRRPALTLSVIQVFTHIAGSPPFISEG